MLIRGVTIEICQNAEAARASHEVGSAGGRLVAWFDFNTSEDFELGELQEDASMPQGESMFF